MRAELRDPAHGNAGFGPGTAFGVRFHALRKGRHSRGCEAYGDDTGTEELALYRADL